MLGVSKWIWALFILSSLFFVLFPGVDLEISSLFFQEHFLSRHETLWVYFLYYSVKYVIIVTMAAFLILWAYNHFKHKTVGNVNGKVVLYLLLVLALGPGLIVNALLKENWGRARPADIIQYHGEKTFTPAFVMSDQCEKNCSFSCGHAAGAFFMMAPAMLLHRRRKSALALAIFYGVSVGIARIAEGGHFFSDVVVSFFIVYILSRGFYSYLFER